LLLVRKWSEQQIRENDMRYIIRTIAAGAISVAARIIIKKIQQKNETKPSETAV